MGWVTVLLWGVETGWPVGWTIWHSKYSQGTGGYHEQNDGFPQLHHWSLQCLCWYEVANIGCENLDEGWTHWVWVLWETHEGQHITACQDCQDTNFSSLSPEVVRRLLHTSRRLESYSREECLDRLCQKMVKSDHRTNYIQKVFIAGFTSYQVKLKNSLLSRNHP